MINIIRCIHKYTYGMHKAYMRNGVEGERFDLTLQFAHPGLKVNRQFNFNRCLNETVATFLSRVSANIEKVVIKANRKKPLENVNACAALLVNNTPTSNETICKSVFVESNQVTLHVFGQEFHVVINSPFIQSIALPSSMLATFPVFPFKLEAINIDNTKTAYSWFKSRDKHNWELISNDYVCRPNKDAVGHYLKLICEPRNGELIGPEIEIVSDQVVVDCPSNIPFQKRHEFTQQRSKPNEIRIVSYNILADLYADSDYTRQVLYPYCPPHALDINYRKQLIIDEVIGFSSDVICLQEVDRKVFSYDLDPFLSKLNYGSHFTLKGGKVAEGVACFYHLDKFRLLDVHHIILAEELPTNAIFAELWSAVSANDKLKERFIERQTVLQVTVVECVENGKILIVANTHLYFQPDADHIRLLQAAMCIKYIESIYKRTEEHHPNTSIAVIFCGDFNSTPDCGVYALFTSGKVGTDVKDWSSNSEEQVTNLCLAQPFKLASACGTPTYTNYTVGFADCLDYIYFDSQRMEVSQSVPMPSNDELILNTALPSVVFPSDHISLCADLRWRE